MSSFIAESKKLDLLERIAVGIEKLNEDPQIEIEATPPICPHCEHFNPVVAVSEEEGEGPLAEFLIPMRCTECKTVFVAVPLEWAFFQEAREAEQEIQRRKELFGGRNSGTN